MKTGRLIFLDGLFNFIVYGNFLSVYNFFDSLAIFVFAGTFCFYSYFLKVVFFFYCKCDQTFRYLTDFLSLCFCGNDLTII